MTRPLLVRAALREPVERTPVWFMRQAGRSLPEYRAIRERHGFFEVAGTPELCAEVTLQPVRRHGVDAAVMFADIMSPVLGMGVALELVEGVGPVIEQPIATLADVERLRVTEPEEWAGPILEAVRIVRGELDAGEGGDRLLRRPVHGRRLSRRGQAEPRLRADEDADVPRAGGVARADGQARRAVGALRRREGRSAGADVIQLFDSWVGALSPADYEEFVEPYSARILAAVDVPTIHFGTGATAPLLQRMIARRRRRDRLDWRLPLDVGAPRGSRGVQGNLDPALLLGPWERVEARALRRARRRRERAAATSSTSATACCRRPTRRCSRGSPRSSRSERRGA